MSADGALPKGMHDTPTQALEPCPNPWCNSHKTVDCEIRAAETPIVMPSRSGTKRAVACPVCPIQTPYFDTEAEAIVAWNQRHRQSSNAASVGADAAKAALAKIGWRIENRGGADIRVGEDWCSPATDSDTLMFNALSGIASEPTTGVDRENAAWEWLERTFGKPDDDAVEATYDAIQMVQAFHAGRAALAASGWMTIAVDEAARVIGIDHPTRAKWTDVYRAMVAVRDHINDRIAKQAACPVRPAELAEPLSDLHPLGQEYDGDALREALERISKLTPFSANAATAEDFAATVHAIADSALSDRPQAEGEVNRG